MVNEVTYAEEHYVDLCGRAHVLEYRLLEEEGVITSHAGAKSAVSLDADAAGRIRAQLLEQEGLHTVRSLRQMGVGREEALALIGRLWEEKEADE